MGYLYVVIKVWIGSHLALKKKPDLSERHKCLKNFFIDTLTSEVVGHFNERPNTAEENQASSARMKKSKKVPW